MLLNTSLEYSESTISLAGRLSFNVFFLNPQDGSLPLSPVHTNVYTKSIFSQKTRPRDRGCWHWKDFLVKLFSWPDCSLGSWAWYTFCGRGRERRGKKKLSKGFVLQVAGFCVVTGCRNQASFRNPSSGESSQAHAVVGLHTHKSRATQCYWSLSCFFSTSLCFTVPVTFLWTSGGLWLFFPINCMGCKAIQPSGNPMAPLNRKDHCSWGTGSETP